MDDTVQIRVEAAGDSSASLLTWLRAEPDLRGRVHLAGSPPQPDSLGTVADVLTVAVGEGGVASVLASALIAWIRRRTGDTVVTLTRPDGSSMEVKATEVRGLSPESVAELVQRVNESLTARPGPAAPAPADDE
jgi:hypothetical protein